MMHVTFHLVALSPLLQELLPSILVSFLVVQTPRLKSVNVVIIYHSYLVRRSHQGVACS